MAAQDPTETLPLSSVPALAREHVALLFYGRRGAIAVRLSKGESVVVGRSAPADVALGDESVSREHARFSVGVHGEILLEDLGSTNGVFVNSERIVDATPLTGDEQVALGAVSVGIHRLAGSARRLKGLLGHDDFVLRVDEEVARAEEFRRPLTILLVRTPGHVDRAVPALVDVLRRVDRVGLYSDSVLEVLLPEVDAEQALEQARALLGAAPGIAIGLAAHPVDGRTTDELLARATSALARAEAGDVVHADASAGSSDADEAPVVMAPSMHALFELVDRAARARLPVLVRGETGAGKEVVARALHERGSRRGRPMISVNCGGLPHQLVESTLFGHEKGAFTGADEARAGLFEAADGGTLFLDEIGELPAAAQAALLRVLETGRVSRVGGVREVEVDVRVVAATHRDLDGMVARGAFREDLLFRLNALTLDVPPLRERREAIPELALRFLERACKDNGLPLVRCDDAALAALRAYAWPGNVRELKNVIDRAVVVARGGRITVDDLPARVLEAQPPAQPRITTTALSPDGPLLADFKSQMKAHERQILLGALQRAGGVQTEAAKLLDMPLRTFVHKLKALGIKRVAGGYEVSED